MTNPNPFNDDNTVVLELDFEVATVLDEDGYIIDDPDLDNFSSDDSSVEFVLEETDNE